MHLQRNNNQCAEVINKNTGEEFALKLSMYVRNIHASAASKSERLQAQSNLPFVSSPMGRQVKSAAERDREAGKEWRVMSRFTGRMPNGFQSSRAPSLESTTPDVGRDRPSTHGGLAVLQSRLLYDERWELGAATAENAIEAYKTTGDWTRMEALASVLDIGDDPEAQGAFAAILEELSMAGRHSRRRKSSAF